MVMAEWPAHPERSSGASFRMRRQAIRRDYRRKELTPPMQTVQHDTGHAGASFSQLHGDARLLMPSQGGGV